MVGLRTVPVLHVGPGCGLGDRERDQLRIAALTTAVDRGQELQNVLHAPGQDQGHGAEMVCRQQQHQTAAATAELFNDQAALPDRRMHHSAPGHFAQRGWQEIAQPPLFARLGQNAARGWMAFPGLQVRGQVQFVCCGQDVLLGERSGALALTGQRTRQPGKVGLPQVLCWIVRQHASDQRQMAELPAR